MTTTEDANSLKEFLASRDAPCPNCGYNLRGIQTTNCPECRFELLLGVGLQDSRYGLYITMLVGFGAGVGFFGLALLIICLQAMSDGWKPPIGEPLLLVGSGLTLFVAMLVVGVRWGRAFRRQTRPRRLALAIFACVCPIAAAFGIYLIAG